MADLDDIFDCFDENQAEEAHTTGPIVVDEDVSM